MKYLMTFCLLICLTSLGFAQMPSLDAFLGPLDNDSSKGIAAPTAAATAVSVSRAVITTDGTMTPVITAETMQDGVVVGAKTLKQGQQTCLVIKVGSGTGYMAEGNASYKESTNRNVMLLSKRDAYIRSYLLAKASLAKFLYGMDNQSVQALDQSLSTYDATNASLVNTSYVTRETIEQKVEGLIRGAVIYSIDDNTKDHQVTTMIVTTPKTRGETMVLSPGFLLANSAREGLAVALKEVKAGVIPPSGGKVVVVPSAQGEQFYFIAFGSEIIRTNADKDVALELKRNSFRVAEMRAGANLAGLIVGDQLSWIAGYSSTSIEENRQYEEVLKTDPTTKEQSVVRIPLKETLKAYEQEAKTTNSYTSAQSGKVPAGVNAIRWESEDGDWSYVAMIYNPAISLDAAKLATLMTQGPSVLDQADTLANQAANQSKSSGIGTGNTDPNKPVEAGPTGQVTTNGQL